jgi:hypothetical protein
MSNQPTADSGKTEIEKIAKIYAEVHRSFHEVMKNAKLVHPDLQKALDNLNAIGRHLNADFDGKWQEEAIRLVAVANKSLAEVAAGAGKRDPSAYIGTEKDKQDGKDGPSLHLAFPGSPRSEKYAWTPLYEMGG